MLRLFAGLLLGMAVTPALAQTKGPLILRADYIEGWLDRRGLTD